MQNNIVQKSSRSVQKSGGYVQDLQKAAEHVMHEGYMKYICLLTCWKFSLENELNVTFFKNKSTNDSPMLSTHIAAIP